MSFVLGMFFCYIYFCYTCEKNLCEFLLGKHVVYPTILFDVLDLCFRESYLACIILQLRVRDGAPADESLVYV